MTEELRPELAEKIRYDVPNSARIWNYWMGGKDNYSADREAGDAFAASYPDITRMAVQCRQFIIRAVRYLTREAGIRQFLDIGTGLPTMQNTHEVAQGVAPDSKIVYVDNDPIVLTHARALLTNTTPEGVTDYIDADYHDPESIISQARNILNFNQPIAVMFMGSLGHVAKFDTVLSIVARTMDAVPSGSYLAHYECTDDPRFAEACATMTEPTPARYIARSPKQVADVFEGFELVEPGVVPVNAWRPNNVDVGREQIIPVDAYGGVARKP